MNNTCTFYLSQGDETEAWNMGGGGPSLNMKQMQRQLSLRIEKNVNRAECREFVRLAKALSEYVGKSICPILFMIA